MGREIDPADIGKHPVLIKKAQAEMTQSDVLVCGRCHGVFHFIELFKEHKAIECKKESSLKDCRETKAKVWAFLLWKASQLNIDGLDASNVNSWKLYQTWVKLEESVRETWIVAGRTIQSFARMGQGNLQEMPVKITKTIIEATPDSPDKKLGAHLGNKFPKKVDPKPIAKISDDMDTDENKDTENDTDESKVVKKVMPIKKPEPTVLNKSMIPKKSVAKRTSPATNDVIEEDVEKILAKRFNPRRKEHEYLVKWQRFPHDQNTWEPLIHLQTCQSVLEYFEIQLAKQKEQRAAAAARTLQQQQLDKTKVSPAANSAQNPAIPRPARNSKAKAVDQVKQWCADEDSGQSGVKRKQQDSDYEDEDEEGEEEEDVQSNKKFKSDNSSVAQAFVKAGQTGNVKIMQMGTNKILNGTAGKVGKDDNNSAEVILTTPKDGKQSGVVKKPGAMANKSPPKNEAQVRVISKGESVSSGVVRIIQNSTSPQLSPVSAKAAPRVVKKTIVSVQEPKVQIKQQIITRPTPAVVAQRPGITRVANNAVAPTPKITTIQRNSMSPKTNTIPVKPTITRIMKSSPTAKVSTSEQKIMSLSKQGLKVVKRSTPNLTSTPTAQESKYEVQQDEEDDGLLDPFPSDFPTPAPPSPPRELTLCPFTGKVLGQAEGEPTPTPSPELRAEAERVNTMATKKQNKQSAIQHAVPAKKVEEEPQPEAVEMQTEDTEVHQYMTNEDGSPIIVAGTDGTLYQVAGKNAEGQTILIAQGADGEQSCVLVASQEGDEEGVLTLDAAVSEAVAQMVPQDGQQLTAEQAAQYEMKDDGGEMDPSQQLTIQTADSDSQDGQITAEVVQADLPSPGGTRRVVLLLPDGSFMMTEVNEEQYQSLNLVN